MKLHNQERINLPANVSSALIWGGTGCLQTALLNLYGHSRAFTGSKLVLISASAMHLA